MSPQNLTAPAWNATLRTTCVATQIEGGHAQNALPQLATANVNCRVLPEDSVEYVQSTLKGVIADDNVNLTITGEVSKGPASPMREDVLRAVSRLTDTLWPGVPTVPIMVMGATDGLYLRSAGNPTYGVQGFFMDRRAAPARFIAFRSHWGFESEFCTPGEGHEKGGVAGEGGQFRRNHLVPVPKVRDLEELNLLLAVASKQEENRIIEGRAHATGEQEDAS